MGDIVFILVCTATILGPLHLLAWRQLSLLDDPGYLRRRGVVILRPEAIERYGEVIGNFRGAPIYANLTFKGMRYDYDCVMNERDAERIGESELYLAPGLLYRTVD
jgi:hypothetical protein